MSIKTFFSSLSPAKMKGKTIVWWCSLNLVGIWWYAMLTKTTIDGAITATYIAIIGTYGATKAYEGRKNEPPTDS